MKPTRRNLLASAGAAAVAGAWPDPSFLVATPGPPVLPPPLKPEVFHERQRQLRALAATHGLDALFITPSANLAYSSNLSIAKSERLTVLLLIAGGPSVLVTPAFEESNHRRDGIFDDLRVWKEEEDPIALVAKALGGKKTIGIEGTTSYSTVALLSANTDAKMQDATSLFDALRMVKTEEEQAFIREASRRTNLAIDATHKRMRAGMTEREVSRILEEEFGKLGVRGGGLVQFGPSSALPHGSPGDRRLAKGDVVLIDCGCKIRGYSSDITRTVAYGPPSNQFRKVYAVVDQAQIAGIEALKAGTSGEEVDRVARRVIEDVGYGENFSHRLGHGLGLDGHEPPYLVRGNRAPLSIGNTVTIEPGIYIPDRFGARIEDDYAVRQSYPASLSARPGELVVLPA